MKIPKSADDLFDFLDANFGRIFIGIGAIVVAFWVFVLLCVIVGIIIL